MYLGLIVCFSSYAGMLFLFILFSENAIASSLFHYLLIFYVTFFFSPEIACWMYTGERQVSTLRKKYLEAVLKQDVGFFDTDARTGDIVFSVSTDTLLVQDAISEKV